MEQQKKPTVALSSTESMKYMTIIEGTKKVVWLQGLFGELELQNLENSTTFYGDNQRSLNLTHNLVYHGRIKCIGVKQHFIREKFCLEKVAMSTHPPIST